MMKGKWSKANIILTVWFLVALFQLHYALLLISIVPATFFMANGILMIFEGFIVFMIFAIFAIILSCILIILILFIFSSLTNKNSGITIDTKLNNSSAIAEENKDLSLDNSVNLVKFIFANLPLLMAIFFGLFIIFPKLLQD